MSQASEGPRTPSPSPPPAAHGYRVGLALAALLGLCTLPLGFLGDDYSFLLMMDGTVAGFERGIDLYNFAPGDAAEMARLWQRGPYPWWTLPSLKVWFVRPLAALALRADHALFGHQAGGYHLHSALWYLALCAAAALVLRRCFGRAPVGWLGPLALALFAVHDSHAMALGWIANRHSTIAVTLALLALHLHLRAREEGARAGAWPSAAALALALGASETALGGLGYLLAYEALGRPPGERALVRVRALAPAAAVTALYLCIYRFGKLGGFGVSGSGSYLDPLSDPRAFLAAAPLRALVLLSGFLGGPAADILPGHPELLPVIVGFGVVALPLTALGVRVAVSALDSHTRRHLAWLGAGALLSLGPTLGGLPGGRLLLAPSLGGVALLAALLSHALGAARAPARSAARLGWRVALPLLVFLHLLRPPLMMGVILSSFRGISAAGEAMAAALPLPPARDADVVLIAASDLLPSIFVPAIGVVRSGLVQRSFRTLSMAAHDHRLTRVSADTIELEVIGGSLLEGPFEKLFRGDASPLATGDIVHAGPIEVRVLATAAGKPTRFAVTFLRPLDDQHTFLVTFEAGLLRPFTLPPIGGQVVIKHWRGPFEG